MWILGIDTELTSLDKDQAELVEVGLVVYDVVRDMVIASYGQLLRPEAWSEEAEKCHGIPRDVTLLAPSPIELPDPWNVIPAEKVEFIVAHNARCDHPVVTKVWPSFLRKPWLCTNEDLPHLDKLPRANCTRLAHLCLDYGIQMSGAWHRALADAEACARIAAKHDLAAAYEKKLAPKFKLVAQGPYIADMKDKLREAPSVQGTNRYYTWDSESKTWSREGLSRDDIKLDAEYIKKITKGRWTFVAERMPPKPY